MSGYSKRSPSPAQAFHAMRKPSYGPSYDANIHNFAPVARIMKTALPENAKIAKEAKECMQECVSEFISFITSEGRPFFVLPVASRADFFSPLPHSVGKVPTGEAQDRQCGGLSLG